eukprot:scaffold25699_cov137-Cylindrotheca_fusiformis.AAC.4
MTNYIPPPSFLGEELGPHGMEAFGSLPKGTSLTARKSRQNKPKDGAGWAPKFVVGDAPNVVRRPRTAPIRKSSGISPPAKSDSSPGVINSTPQEKISLAAPTTKGEATIRYPSRPSRTLSPSALKPRTTVAWNEHLVVVDPSVQSSCRATSSVDVRPNSKSSIVSRTKNSSQLDQATLQMRLEWSKLLINKAFDPYARMICDTDDDLPDIEALDEIADDGCCDENEDIRKIKDSMLSDPNLTEREVISFFAGLRLFQIKVNSLTAQLQGAKAMHRLAARSFVAPRPMRSTRSMVLNRSDSQAIKALDATYQTSEIANTSGREAIPISRASFSRDREGGELDNLHTDKRRDHGVESDQKALDRSFKSLRVMSIQRIRRETANEESADVRKLLEELEEAENRQKKLEKQLAQAGIVIAEDIPYAEAKEMVSKIASRMAEIGSSDVADKQLREEYFKLERDMEKYSTALQLTDEWAEEQEELEKEWEESVEDENEEALMKVRRHMPVDVRNQSEDSLSTNPSPNGRLLPRAIAKKFKRTDCLQLLRVDPSDIFPMHPSTLENMRVTGMTLTERRSLYHHLREVGSRWKAMGADKMMERKWIWFNMMKSNFKESVESWQRHVAEYGPPGNHPYATKGDPLGGCPLVGRQCPLRADKEIDYAGDYGHPVGSVYFRAEVRKFDVKIDSTAKVDGALKEKKLLERSATLKRHYKSKILQVSLANGSCELMDATMDRVEETLKKWAEEDYCGQKYADDEKRHTFNFTVNESLSELKLSAMQLAERSGLQLSGKRDCSRDIADIRSLLEISLCEEVVECAKVFMDEVETRMRNLKLLDGRILSSMKHLQSLLVELHGRNTNTLYTFGEVCPARSRRLRTCNDFVAEMKKEASLHSVGNKVSSVSKLGGARRGQKNGGSLDAIVRDNRRVLFVSVLLSAAEQPLLLHLLQANHGHKRNGGLLAAIAARDKVS